MSLRTTERIFITSSLALMLAAGCGDGDNLPAVDGGGLDSGRGPDAGRDTGSDEDELPARACGSRQCTGAIVSNTVINPCCVEETNGCGLDADDLRRANASTPFTGCVPKDVEAAVENSVYCGEFWDQVEMVQRDNDGLDIAAGVATLTFDGCCLPNGECGALINTPRNGDPESINTHLGCVSFSRLEAAFAAADAGTMVQPERLPYCTPSGAGGPPTGNQTVPNVPKFVCGCGEGKLYDPEDKSRIFPCLNNLPTTVCGREEPSAGELAMVPEFICGCSTSSRLPCLTNVDPNVCGSKQIDASSEELALIPSFVCGGTAVTDANGLPALKGVDASVCGKKTPTAADLAMVPEFLCGCTAANAATGFPCLRTVERSVCGGLAVTSSSTELLAPIPEFVCGCGADVVDPQTSLTCLSHVETSVCGGKEITATSGELAAVPEFICGAEGLTGTPALPVLRNVESSVCGTKEITASSPELALIPQFICGKDNNPDTSAMPKLAGVDVAICGGKTIAAGATELASLPALVCGCGGAAPTNEFGCLRNVAADVCGTNLSQIPAATCGCGATTALGATERLCIPYTAATTCGSLAITLDSTNNCLTNIPEYAVGCGSSTPSASNPCIPGAPAVHGCTQVTSGTIRGVPTILCGCGDDRLANGLPCVDNVPTTVCGAQTVPLAGLTTIPASICGCGAAVTYDPANQATFPRPCLSKTATTSCGPAIIRTSDPNNTPGTTADDCYTDWPAYLNGCGAGVTSGNCIYNASATNFGCVQPSAGRSVPALPYFACGCGRGAFPTRTPAECIPNVDTDVCGAAAPTSTTTASAPTFFCGCGPTVAARPAGAPASRPCLSYTETSTCGTGSGGLDAAVLATLPSTLCGCGASTTWDPANTTSFPGPCLSQTGGETCGGTQFCDETAAAGTAPCTGAQVCLDARGGAGAGPFGVGGAGDGLGDTCQ